MSVLTILTIIFLVLKLTNYIDWPWWLVVLPSIIYTVIYSSVYFWWESKSPSEKIRFKLWLNS